MRITRAKQYRRRLRFYRIVYGIAPPYKVLLDGNFIHTCLKHKVELGDRIHSVLQGEKYKLLVPRMAVDELKALGDAFQPAYAFATRQCQAVTEHAAGKESPAEQIQALVGKDNPNRYIVATQDEELRAHLRDIPGCPLLHLNKTVLLMEAPSGKTQAAFEALERSKTGMTEEDREAVDAVRADERKRKAEAAAVAPVKRLKKKPSAPNPLSCLPKKRERGKKKEGEGAKRKRKRKGGGASAAAQEAGA